MGRGEEHILFLSILTSGVFFVYVYKFHLLLTKANQALCMKNNII